MSEQPLHWRLSEPHKGTEVYLGAPGIGDVAFYVYAVSFSNSGQADTFRDLLSDGIQAKRDGIRDALEPHYLAALQTPRKTTRVSR